MEPVDAAHPTLEQWESGALPERDQLAEELVQLFTSSSVASSSSNANANANISSAEAIAARPITRRPGVEEVRNCILSSAYPCIPPSCATLRGEIWQVLLNVYKRNQHGAAAQEFERMIARLSKLPRDPLLVEECRIVSQLLCTDADDEDKRAQIQSDLEILLVWFLTTKSVEYARGMARVVGVFFSLQLPLPTVYDCFYQFCASFLPHFVTATPTSFPGVGVGVSTNVGANTNNLGKLSTITPASESDADTTTSSASSADADTPRQDRRHRERQQLVEQLVAYHAPQLAHFLNQWCPNRWSKPGELIPQELFFEDAFNAVTPSAFIHVMDQYLLTNDSMVGVFLVVAALLNAETALTRLSTKYAVAECIRREFEVATRDPQRMAFVGVLASRLRARTPTSYKQALVEAQDAFCASRKALEIAFQDARTPTAKPDVDMSQWQKRESRSFAGKVFWYHTPTGRTQWEHPAEVLDPAPALFALPVGVHEVARQVMGEKKSSASASSSSSSSLAPTPTNERLRFFVVDCRALRSSADLKSGRIPAAYTLDPSVFDSPELIERSMGALDAIKSQVHVVLVGDGVGLPPELIKSEELKTSVRDAVRHDADSMNRAALFFQKRGFRFVSCLDGGYSSWHAFMRDDASCAPDELLGHVADECHYCRYDTIVQTGADPRKLKQKTQTRRKKSAMPTTTTMLVNGGEGDASIISTNEGALPNSNSTSGPASRLSRKSLTSSLSLSRTSLTTMNSSLSNMRSKLTMMPKLGGWRRSSSTSSNTAPNDSSSEVDGSSDRGSSTNDEHDHNGQRIAEEEGDASGSGNGAGSSSSTDGDSEPAGHPPASPTQDAKNFVGVFTIDYSDDEDDEEFSAPSGKEAVAAVGAPPAVVVGESAVAPTQSA